MFVIIKSPPGSPGAEEGLRVARERSADILLIGDGVRFAMRGALEDFCGTAFVHGKDLWLRGLGVGDVEKGVKALTAEELVGLLAASDRVEGVF